MTNQSVAVPTVLIIDGFSTQALGLVQALSDESYRCLQAHGLDQANDMFKQSPIDLIILAGENKPDHNVDVCRALRKLPDGEHVVILMLVDSDKDIHFDKARKAGATDVIVTPITQQINQHRIKYLAKFSAMMRSLQHFQSQVISHEYQLRQHAYMDDLTQLPNRKQFNIKLQEAVDKFDNTETQLAVLMLDLDKFKKINDTFGHAVGDQLLRHLSSAINNVMCGFIDDMQLTEDNYLLSRLGGDEFGILVYGLKKSKDISTLCDRLFEFFAKNIQIEDKNFYISPSIGIAKYPHDGDTPEHLIKNADTAMMNAKQAGRNTFYFYNGHMSFDYTGCIELENSLRQAIEQNEFVLNYQPLIDLKSNSIIGAETLIRWNHPTQGVIGPNAFIPIAEDMGILNAITDFVLEQACVQYQIWCLEGLFIDKLSVNVSPSYLKDQHLMTRLVDMMATYEIPPNVLTIELTEGILMDNTQATLEILQAISALGILISIDDFGTGYSSLSYLKRYPLNHLKIDRSFMQNVPGSEADCNIIHAIVDMAHALNFSVIAEGVEDQAHVAYLHEVGCEYAQGYLYSMAVPPEQFAALLKGNNQKIAK